MDLLSRHAIRFAMQACATALPALPAFAAAVHDGSRDFDFSNWKTHLKRLQHPLSSSTTRIEYNVTTVARTVWDGRANRVRSVIMQTDTAHFEQAFSGDGGKTWNINRIAHDARE